MTKLNSAACAAIAAALVAFPVQAGPGEKGHGHDHDAPPAQTERGHGSHDHGQTMNPAVGEAGDPADVRRSIRITMTDNAYSPKSITVSTGETVRFLVENKGELVHEFNIGTAEMHMAHQSEMMAMMQSGALELDRIVHEKMGAMQHDDPNSILLEPGKTGEVVWKFGASGEIEFACNVPGHYDAGMHGVLRVR